MRALFAILGFCFFVFGFGDENLDSSVLVNLENIPPTAQNIVLDYDPDCGHPPPHSVFPISQNRIIINGTKAAHRYRVNVSAVAADGHRISILRAFLYSSPPRPILEFLRSEKNGVSFELRMPISGDFRYYIEYFIWNKERESHFVETAERRLRIGDLQPNSRYRLRVFSLFRNVPSISPLDTEFRTLDSKSTEENVFEVAISATERTVLGKPTISALGTLEKVAAELLSTHSTQKPTTRPANTATKTQPTKPTVITPKPHPKSTASILSTTTLPKTTSPNSTFIPKVSPTTPTTLTTPTAPTTTPTIPTVPTTNPTAPTATTTTQQTKTPKSKKIEVISADEEEEKEEENEETKEEELRAHREGDRIRLEWEPPESELCTEFLINTTILDLSKQQSFISASENPFAHIRFYEGHRVEVKVFCMSEGAVSGIWSIQRILLLNKPLSVQNLRILKSETSEFYISSVTLGIDWPSGHNSSLYEIVVSWGQGKETKGNRKIFRHPNEEMRIEKLESATAFTFTVRNVSRDLQLESGPSGVRQMTPPVITSTISPGQISSHSINMNFDESEPDYPFDHYELIFAGNPKNISKRIEKKATKSFTFNKLIPGKTYRFLLYTVYKNVRSRAVVEDITAYPLKVKTFNAVAAPGSVALFWSVENLSENECHFRLEYASTANNGLQKSHRIKLGNVNHYKFGSLEFDTYYTFTITVLMGNGKAEAESESEMITIGFKGKPMNIPQLKRYGSWELQLTFDEDPNIFGDINGVVDNYAVVVSQNPKAEEEQYELPSYYDIKEEENWKSYRASPSDYNPFKRHSTATFIIGNEECNRRKLNEPFCNGPLRPRVDYWVKVRAYLVSNMAVETEWVSVNGIATEEKDTEEKSRERQYPSFMYLNGKSCAIRSFGWPLFSILYLILN